MASTRSPSAVVGGGTIERIELSSGTVEPFSGRGCCGFEDGDVDVASSGAVGTASDGVSLVVADLFNDSVRRVSIEDGSAASWLMGPATVQEDDSAQAVRQPRGTYVLNSYGVRLLAD